MTMIANSLFHGLDLSEGSCECDSCVLAAAAAADDDDGYDDIAAAAAAAAAVGMIRTIPIDLPGTTVSMAIYSFL